MCDLGRDTGPVVNVAKAKAMVGWRWCEVGGEGTLRPWSTNQWDDVWSQPIAKADQKPTETNDNGLHLFRSKAIAMHPEQHPGDDGYVLVKVKFWGDCVEHERGFRAQYAKILSLSFVRGRGLRSDEKTKARIRKGNPKLKLRFVK